MERADEGSSGTGTLFLSLPSFNMWKAVYFPNSRPEQPIDTSGKQLHALPLFLGLGLPVLSLHLPQPLFNGESLGAEGGELWVGGEGGLIVGGIPRGEDPDIPFPQLDLGTADG